ncbi:MAG: hypothetical protein ABIT01_19555 [Thermoanaerobaculia bacterium]
MKDKPTAPETAITETAFPETAIASPGPPPDFHVTEAFTINGRTFKKGDPVTKADLGCFISDVAKSIKPT